MEASTAQDPTIEAQCRAAFAAAYPGLELVRLGPKAPACAHPTITSPVLDLLTGKIDPHTSDGVNMWFVRVGGVTLASDALAARLTIGYAKSCALEVFTAPWDYNNILTIMPGAPPESSTLLRYHLEPSRGEAAAPLDPMVDAGSLYVLWAELNLIESPCPARFVPYADETFRASARDYQMYLREDIERAEGEARASLERRLALTEQNGGFAAE